MFLCITFFFYDIKSVAFIFADYHTTCLKCIKGGGGGGIGVIKSANPVQFVKKWADPKLFF